MEKGGQLQEVDGGGLLVHLLLWLLPGLHVFEGKLDLPWPDEDDDDQQVQEVLPPLHAHVHLHIPSQV